jgi:small subunit ribosomal protein S5
MPQRVSDGFDDKLLDLRRVTRVMKGGKRFRFRATVVVGDKAGRVGVGVAKGLDVPQAINKAKVQAKKHLVIVERVESRTISHEVLAKYSAAKVLIRPASLDHGLRAGGSVRAVLELAGVKDATAKCIGRTSNKLTNAMATLEALRELRNVKRLRPLAGVTKIKEE